MTRKISGVAPSFFPTYKQSQSERRLLSILLRTAQQTPELCQKLLTIPAVNRSKRDIKKAHFLLEPTFNPPFDNVKHSIPDAYIIVGKTKLFIEAKVGKSNLDKSQLEDYIKIASELGITHILTISNQMTAHHTDHPTGIKSTKRVKLSHVSWMHLGTEIEQILKSNEQLSNVQTALLVDLLDYMEERDTSGVAGFTAMGKAWQELCDRVDNRKIENHIFSDVIDDWLQEEKEIALKLTRMIVEGDSPVTLYLPNKHRNDRSARHKDLVNNIVKHNKIETQYTIPRAASPLTVKIDMTRKAITIEMCVKIEDKFTLKGQMNSLRNMLSNNGDIFTSCIVNVRERNARGFEHFTFEQLFTKSWEYKNLQTRCAIDIICVYEVPISKAAFRSGKNFITTLEDAVENFHRYIGRHLINQRRPPSDVIDD